MAGQGHCPVQICNNIVYVRHKLTGTGHCVRCVKNIYFTVLEFLKILLYPTPHFTGLRCIILE